MFRKTVISLLSVLFSVLAVCPAIADTLQPGEAIRVGESVFSNN